jgi:hypothetical protein
LTTESRPREVSSWIKRHAHKKHEPVTIEANEYGNHFCKWWTALQPSWRVLSDGRYSKEVPADETWVTIRKGGGSGLYIVVMALSWWVRALDAANPTGDTTSKLWAIVEDLHWVLQQVSDNKDLGKRKKSDDAWGKGKRYV